MAFWKKKQKEKIYDCANRKDYIEYRKVAFEKYQDADLRSLKHNKFMIEAKQDKTKSMDSGIAVTLSLNMVTLLLHFFFGDIRYSDETLLQSIFSIVYLLVLIFCIFYIAALYGSSHNGTTKEISMLKLEKQVIEELILEKLKSHKAKVKVRKK